MRLVVTTVFEAIDQEFVDRFISRMRRENDRDLAIAMDDLEKTGYGLAHDINPDEPEMQVTTTYRVVFSGDQEGRGLQEANI